MALTGQQTTYAVTQLLSSLTQGYTQGLQLVREERSRMAKLELLRDREARAAAAEEERLSIARERLEETKQTEGLRRKKLRSDITLQDLKAKKVRKSMVSPEDPFTGGLPKSLTDNFKSFKSAQDAHTKAVEANKTAELEYNAVVAQKIPKESTRYKNAEANRLMAQNNLSVTRSNLNRISSSRSYLLQTDSTFNRSPQRGTYRAITRSLMTSGYSKPAAMRLVNDYDEGLRLKDAGDPRMLQAVIEKVQNDSRIKPALKLEIGNWLKRAAGERTNYVEARPGDAPFINVEEAVRDYTPGPEDDEFDDPMVEEAAKRLGVTPQMAATDREASEALEQEVAQMERSRGAPPALTEFKDLPRLRTETPVTEDERTKIKEKVKKGRKKKREIKRSAYWSRHWSDKSFGGEAPPPKHWSLRK